MNTVSVTVEDGPMPVSFAAAVEYHGHGALAMLALTFRAVGLALEELSGGQPPARDAISVVSGHPGPGVRDAFEVVTRCVTRGVYTVDKTLPGPRLNPRTDAVYAYDITVAGRGTAHIEVLDGVLPGEFFVPLDPVTATRAQKLQQIALRRRIADRVLAEDVAKLFAVTIPDGGTKS